MRFIEEFHSIVWNELYCKEEVSIVVDVGRTELVYLSILNLLEAPLPGAKQITQPGHADWKSTRNYKIPKVTEPKKC
jgi:hypothetical protein